MVEFVSMTPLEKEAQLTSLLSAYRNAVVAFSGGVDSSYLAWTAHRVLGDRACAVTAFSPSVSRFQRKLAVEFARTWGLNHEVIETREMEDFNYTSNPTNRCYFCKTELYGLLNRMRKERDFEVILDGSNLDDVGDYRPGRAAAAEQAVFSPLIEVELRKEEIRWLSRRAGLSTWDQPAMPCLSSRFPYGVEITEEKLRRVDEAEQVLRDLGFKNFRVRHHEELARLEVERSEMSRLQEPTMMDEVTNRLQRIGYRHVTLDMRGFRSGSLNEALTQLSAGG